MKEKIIGFLGLSTESFLAIAYLAIPVDVFFYQKVCNYRNFNSTLQHQLNVEKKLKSVSKEADIDLSLCAIGRLQM